jgi:hypothetical protein
MKIGTIIRSKQPGVYRKLNEKLKRRRDKQEHLSFLNYKSMMEERHVYKRVKGGAWRQVK